MNLSAQGKVTTNKWAEPGFSSGVAAPGLVFPACPLGPTGFLKVVGEWVGGDAGLHLCVPSLWRGAWHMVGLGQYLWNHFLPTPLFIVGNTEVKRKCPGSKCVHCLELYFLFREGSGPLLGGLRR